MPPGFVQELAKGCEVMSVVKGQSLLCYGQLTSGVVVLFDGAASIYLPQQGPTVAKPPQAEQRDSCMVRRNAATHRDGLAALDELKFQRGHMFGIERAFHNISAAAVKQRGMMTCSASVAAMADCQALIINQPEHIVALEAAFKKSQSFKIALLQQMAHYKHCGDAVLRDISKSLTRRSCSQGTVLVKQGDVASSVFFCISGKLTVFQQSAPNGRSKRQAVSTTRSKPVAVLGAGSCFGDWAVLSGGPKKRSASLVCSGTGDCDILEISSNEFMRVVPKIVQGALLMKQALVAEGLSLASATQRIEEELLSERNSGRSVGDENGYPIVRKRRRDKCTSAKSAEEKKRLEAPLEQYSSQLDRTDNATGLLHSGTAAEFFHSRARGEGPHHNLIPGQVSGERPLGDGLVRQRSSSCPVLPSPPATPASAEQQKSAGSRRDRRLRSQQRARSSGLRQSSILFPPLPPGGTRRCMLE